MAFRTWVLAWVVLLVSLCLAAAPPLPQGSALETTYSVKVALVREGHVEGKFVTMPQDMRVMCDGETKGLSAGDYAPLKVDKEGTIWLGHARCSSIAWLR